SFAPERAGALVRVEVGRTAVSALCPGGTSGGNGPGAGSGDDPDPGRNPPIYGGASGRTPLHIRFEPPRLPLCNDIQGGVPSPVRTAGPHLAAAAEEGACSGVAAGLLS